MVRRIHLYLGLLLCPFVFFFGLTGLSFNHPTIGRGLSSQAFPPEALRASGFVPWSARDAAEELYDS